MKRPVAVLLAALLAWRCGDLALPTSPTQLCQNPAPLIGEETRAFPGADPDDYVVVFKDGYSAPTEAARLASKYRFTVVSVYTIISGFSARLRSSIVNDLRCEPSVQSVQFSATNIPPP